MRDVEPPSYVIISGYHDYRSKRRANLHFIADELTKRGDVFFLSLRYSHLTRRREDPRHNLWARANRLERVNGVDCYLWRTPIHPFRMPAHLRLAERALFGLFAQHLPRPARERIAQATHIFVESGIGIMYLPLLRRLNPTGQIIYMASDSLGAINQADTIKRAFQRYAHFVDSARLPSPFLRDDVPASIPCYFIPHGIEKERFAQNCPSPYRPGTTNAVSVGSMLFDNSFFEIAGPAFPDITFHVIGSGHTGPNTANVLYYDEMPFEATLPYLKHATFAIAAYGEGVAPYLTHISMKLMQYGFLGLPAVCPEVVAGEGLGRVGYFAKDTSSIDAAISKTLNVRWLGADCLDWNGVTTRLLRPDDFNISESIRPALSASAANHDSVSPALC